MAKAKKKPEETEVEQVQTIQVSPPRIGVLKLLVEGVVPYVQNTFSKKERDKMRQQQEAGGAARAKRKREPRDFKSEFEQSCHKAVEGWYGIPSPGIRASLISACRVAGIVMTQAKLSVFVEPDGFDAEDGTPLTKIIKGKPKQVEHMVRIGMGTSNIAVRGMWDPGWQAQVTISFDMDMIDANSVVNLLSRAGRQVGWGEGRPDSKKSAGQGWGLFRIVETKEMAA